MTKLFEQAVVLAIPSGANQTSSKNDGEFSSLA
jgi:hypothetical protein